MRAICLEGVKQTARDRAEELDRDGIRVSQEYLDQLDLHIKLLVRAHVRQNGGKLTMKADLFCKSG